MGDSQNWSSFDEPAAPKKPKAAVKPQPKPVDARDASGAASTSPSGLLSPANVRLVQQRLMFGAIVGFCTGATFGTSTFDTSWRARLRCGDGVAASVGALLMAYPLMYPVSIGSRRDEGVPQAARPPGARGAQPVHARGRCLGRVLRRVPQRLMQAQYWSHAG